MQRLKQLEDEKRRLKQMVAEQYHSLGSKWNWWIK